MSMLLEPDVRGLGGGANGERCPTPTPPGSPGTSHDSCSIAPLTPSQSPRSDAHSCPSPSFAVVVAIDFGTTSSGYAFSFRSHPDAIHMMRRWEGGDPGVSNHKTPTCLLLSPDGSFHSFGYEARDAYHAMGQHQAQQWGYFDRFKMKIHGCSELSMRTELEAVNGMKLPALDVFAHSLRFLKQQALQELMEQCPALPESGAIRWVLTVPAIWKQPAKQLMREAAYRAGLVSPDNPEQLLIALEPEAASIYCRKLRLHQVLELSTAGGCGGGDDGTDIESSFRQAREQLRRSRHSRTFVVEPGMGELWAEMREGDRYIVADCGGGSVDLTVHQIERPQGTLKELYKATGGPYGAVGVDAAFEQLLSRIFGAELMRSFKAQRPAAWVDLSIAFEARKRAAAPSRCGPINVSLPFSFIDFYRKQRGHSVEEALRRSDVKLVKWSSQGMLRMSAEAMNELFQPTVKCIVQHIESLLQRPEVRGVKFLFLVGGFADSPVLQRSVRAALGSRCRLLVPHDAALSTLKGAVLFGLDPGTVRVRRSPLTFGVGVLNKFIDGKHPEHKLLLKDGRRWCSDVFDKFVAAEQSVALGEVVQRSYCPARTGQRRTVIDIYCCDRDDVTFVTEPGVTKCGTVSLELPELPGGDGGRREIRAAMQFGDTEIKVTAVDVSSARTVRATIDFLTP